AVFDQAQVPLRGYMILTEMGLEKSKDLKLKREDIDKVKESVKRLFSGPASGSSQNRGGCGCGCG
ncbi:MAG: zinc-binding protein, partial [Desulfarculaceae bacterium]